jgi:hypothetical protein
LFVIVRTEHLSGWKVISQSLSHLAAASRSSWRLSQSFWDLIGIKNQTLNWISSFLSNRTQTVVLDGESSDIAPVTSGVPETDSKV